MAMHGLESSNRRAFYGRPIPEPGMSWRGYVYLAFVVSAISAVGYLST